MAQQHRNNHLPPIHHHVDMSSSSSSSIFQQPRIDGTLWLLLIPLSILLITVIWLGFSAISETHVSQSTHPKSKSQPRNRNRIRIRTTRLRISHWLLNHQIVQEYLQVPIGTVPPPVELIMARAMALSKLDEFDINNSKKKEFMEPLKYGLEDVWCGEGSGFDKNGRLGTLGMLCRKVFLDLSVIDVAMR
ncbi:hypothetical protein HDU76_013789 [Blyttiomyces sp. JEL0837]|nr:hypothetical protein HDU76_013789 [Blyttiomyces sp. JEL0837]